MESSAITMLVDYGALAVFAILFILQFNWLLKHVRDLLAAGAAREKNYQTIITKLSEELPAIREALARIESKVK